MSKIKGNVVEPEEMVEQAMARIPAACSSCSPRLPKRTCPGPNRASEDRAGSSNASSVSSRAMSIATAGGRSRGRPARAAQAASDHPESHRGFQQSLALQYVDRGADGTDQHAVRRRSRSCRARRSIRSCRRCRCCSGRSRRISPRSCGSSSGRTGPVFRQPWPAFDEALAKEDAADVVLQVNGKVRGRLSVPFGTPEDELEKLALADPKVQPFLAGKQMVKMIVVPDKLVNIVVKWC